MLRLVKGSLNKYGYINRKIPSPSQIKGLIVKKEDNINLKNKFHEYQKRFKDYKEEHLKKQNHFHEIYYKHKKKKEITEFFIQRKRIKYQ